MHFKIQLGGVNKRPKHLLRLTTEVATNQFAGRDPSVILYGIGKRLRIADVVIDCRGLSSGTRPDDGELIRDAAIPYSAIARELYEEVAGQKRYAMGVEANIPITSAARLRYPALNVAGENTASTWFLKSLTEAFALRLLANIPPMA